MKQQKITHRTFFVSVALFTVGTSILVAPAALAQNAKQDAWLACIIGGLFNLLLTGFYAFIGRRLKQRSLIQYGMDVLGKWAGTVVGVWYAGFFYLLASLMIGEIGYFLTTQVIPETPIEVLQILFAVVVVLAVRGGFSVYARMAEIFFPLLILLFGVLVFSLMPQIDMDNLAPVLEEGWGGVFKGSISFFMMQETVLLLMFYSKVESGKGRAGAYLYGVALGCFMLLLIAIESIAILGATLTQNQNFPAYALAKSISIGHFLERIEGIIIFIWVLSIFVKVALSFEAALIGLGDLLRDRSTKPYTVPLALGMVILSLMSYRSTFIMQQFTNTWLPIVVISGVLLPVLILSVALLRGK